MNRVLYNDVYYVKGNGGETLDAREIEKEKITKYEKRGKHFAMI